METRASLYILILCDFKLVLEQTHVQDQAVIVVFLSVGSCLNLYGTFVVTYRYLTGTVPQVLFLFRSRDITPLVLGRGRVRSEYEDLDEECFNSWPSK